MTTRHHGIVWIRTWFPNIYKKNWGVSNGPIQFESASKIWSLLELLAKITWVFIRSCSHAWVFVKIPCRVAYKHNLNLENKNLHWKQCCSRNGKLGNIGETYTHLECFCKKWRLCACVRYWPDRWSVLKCVTFTVVFPRFVDVYWNGPAWVQSQVAG